MTFYPDDDDRLWKDSKTDSWFRFPTPLRYLAFLILIILIVVILWNLFAPVNKTYSQADLPLIRADETPFKIKAEDQGIPGIKHQDKLVYGRIRSDQNAPQVEHILPDPEPPISVSDKEEDTVKMVERFEPEDDSLTKIVKALPPSEEPPSKGITSISDLIGEDALPPKSPPSTKAKVVGTTLIQLGSLKSYDLAESEWARLSKKHKDLIGGLESKIQKVDLGEDKGIYFRLRTGPFENNAKATAICTSLKERKVECIVID